MPPAASAAAASTPPIRQVVLLRFAGWGWGAAACEVTVGALHISGLRSARRSPEPTVFASASWPVRLPFDASVIAPVSGNAGCGDDDPVVASGRPVIVSMNSATVGNRSAEGFASARASVAATCGDSYRALLRRSGGIHIEIANDDEGPFEVWPVFHVYRPGDCTKAHQDHGPTLCDSWRVDGTQVATGDGELKRFSTTELLSFASGGYSGEASRWCFYTGGGGVPTIFEESNDYECVLGKYVDDGAWISDVCRPVFPSFEVWLAVVVDVITASPLTDRDDDNDRLMREIVARGRTQSDAP
jgi:hypothetical protein